MGVCLGFLHTPMIDCCNAQLQIPKRDTLLSFEQKKEIDHIVFITNWYMLHETASRKILVFTLKVNPHMSIGVSHFNLLDELIAWSDATVVMWRLI